MSFFEVIDGALRDRFLEYSLVDSDRFFLVESDLSALGAFREIECIVKYIKNNDVDFSSVFFNGSYFIKSSNFVDRLLSIFKIDVEEIKERFLNYEFNPYFKLFSEFNRLGFIRFFLEGGNKRFSHREVVDLIEALNDFVCYIRKEVSSKWFRDRMIGFRRLSNKNYKSISFYIDKMFELHSKLLVIRIDLGYRKGVFFEYEKVKKHHCFFLRSLSDYLENKMKKKSLVGYAWKLEFAPKKLWHYHMMFFLNGQISREDVTIARLIGEYWEIVAEGVGLYYNCNAHKVSYKTLGIGLIDHRDKEKRLGLRKASIYMTKTDYYLKLVAPNKGRSFGKGGIPKGSRNRLGRPRDF